MEINQKFWETIRPILVELRKELGCDFVVFGSSPLYLMNILEFSDKDSLNDIDVVAGSDFCASSAFKEVLFHDDPSQKLYKIMIGGVNIDIGTVWKGRETMYDKILSTSFEWEGFKFASLSVVRDWKAMMFREYEREKDKWHLEKITEYISKNIKIVDIAFDEASFAVAIKNKVWLDTYANEDYGITVQDLKSRGIGDSERLEKMQNIAFGKITDEHVWVAKLKGEIIGICSVEKGSEKNKLVSLYVLSQYQGLSVGTKLFEKALDWLGSDKPIEFGVAEYNFGAIEFYKKFGFEVDGKMADFVLPNKKRIPLIRMIKFP